ncbi:MAG: FAD-dependent oxidoreductase [Candidatus Binatus sp.]|uniref:ferredoxin--NADP reductase n=1 Tax=Candidatus Binatus sp. TaxID=2811406 RepID=UPI00271E8280|nr:FAD-dependent oxidoreductase [Candidatus Binatus sp.]MDO8435011.1 FAD-dependent oxidoreductase [Candidatus Binatus sp.]
MSGAQPAGGRAKLMARVERIFDHASDTRSLFLARVDGARLRFAPGHFISITIPLGDEVRTRPYTIASSPGEGASFEICFNRVPGGRGVAWLFERRVGDTFEFAGPFGAFTMEKAPPVEVGLIAEGTAIAPIRPMLKRALASESIPKMHLIYAAPDEEHLLYRTELDAFAQSQRDFTFEPVIAPSESIEDRLFELAQRRWVDADADRTRQFYICGVGKIVTALRDLLRGAGYERRAVHYEQW